MTTTAGTQGLCDPRFAAVQDAFAENFVRRSDVLVERGLLDLDASVGRYWPEFAQRRKEHILVRWLLGHRAGLPAVRMGMATKMLFDWSAFTAALVKTDPWWEPGTQHGYHARTYGYLVGEVIREHSTPATICRAEQCAVTPGAIGLVDRPPSV